MAIMALNHAKSPMFGNVLAFFPGGDFRGRIALFWFRSRLNYGITGRYIELVLFGLANQQTSRGGKHHQALQIHIPSSKLTVRYGKSTCLVIQLFFYGNLFNSKLQQSLPEGKSIHSTYIPYIYNIYPYIYNIYIPYNIFHIIYIYPYIFHIYSIYIPYIYIFHIYSIYNSIYIPYIFHIYSIYIYIPYIFHIYSIYIPYNIPYIFHIYIYIPYIFHIYSIYIPYIFHIYSIYIPYIYSYIFHIYSIYIPYIPLVIHKDHVCEWTMEWPWWSPRNPPICKVP